MQNDYVSLIFCHYSRGGLEPDTLRSDTMHTSFESLYHTVCHLPVEIIVVDNGELWSDTDFFMKAQIRGWINCLIRNKENMHFGFARNQGLAVAKGNYIGIIDNDLFYEDGWLEKCLLPFYKGAIEKIYTTPLDYPNENMARRYHKGTLNIEGEEYRLSMRAGSNCFIMKRPDFEEVGFFKHHRIAGTKWTDEAVRKGYTACVTPHNMVRDLGLRVGYNHSEPLPIRRVLLNGEEVYFNEDEYRH